MSFQLRIYPLVILFAAVACLNAGLSAAPFQSMRIPPGEFCVGPGAGSIPAFCINMEEPIPGSGDIFAAATDNLLIDRTLNGATETRPLARAADWVRFRGLKATERVLVEPVDPNPLVTYKIRSTSICLLSGDERSLTGIKARLTDPKVVRRIGLLNDLDSKLNSIFGADNGLAQSVRPSRQEAEWAIVEDDDAFRDRFDDYKSALRSVFEALPSERTRDTAVLLAGHDLTLEQAQWLVGSLGIKLAPTCSQGFLRQLPAFTAERLKVDQLLALHSNVTGLSASLLKSFAISQDLSACMAYLKALEQGLDSFNAFDSSMEIAFGKESPLVKNFRDEIYLGDSDSAGAKGLLQQRIDKFKKSCLWYRDRQSTPEQALGRLTIDNSALLDSSQIQRARSIVASDLPPSYQAGFATDVSAYLAILEQFRSNAKWADDAAFDDFKSAFRDTLVLADARQRIIDKYNLGSPFVRDLYALGIGKSMSSGLAEMYSVLAGYKLPLATGKLDDLLLISPNQDEIRLRWTEGMDNVKLGSSGIDNPVWKERLGQQKGVIIDGPPSERVAKALNSEGVYFARSLSDLMADPVPLLRTRKILVLASKDAETSRIMFRGTDGTSIGRALDDLASIPGTSFVNTQEQLSSALESCGPEEEAVLFFTNHGGSVFFADGSVMTVSNLATVLKGKCLPVSCSSYATKNDWMSLADLDFSTVAQALRSPTMRNAGKKQATNGFLDALGQAYARVITNTTVGEAAPVLFSSTQSDSGQAIYGRMILPQDLSPALAPATHPSTLPSEDIHRARN